MYIYPDAIFIGAINYDYIFQGNKKEKSLHSIVDSGREHLQWDRSNGKFDDKIQDMYENFAIKSMQLGGSAYLALRGFKTVDHSLKAAYVGVCGSLSKKDIKKGAVISTNDFDEIDNKDWFFDFHEEEPLEEEDIVGRSYVLLNNNSIREKIEIEPGANNKLLTLIKSKSDGECKLFVDFLSKTRWIHITSLAAFNDFLEIVDCIRKAKQKNPFIKVSADLGDEYTSEKRIRLLEERIFEELDYIFLSNKEKDNLMVNPDGVKAIGNNNLKLLFQANKFKEQQILVVKYENKYELYNKIDDHIQVKSFWQQQLKPNSIINDTGAGDFFAGGFIGGMLSSKFLSHQPTPIEVGSIVAKERLKVNTINSACGNAKIKVDKYIKQLFKDDELNMEQYIKIKWENIKKAWIFSVIISILISFVVGIITGLLVDSI